MKEDEEMAIKNPLLQKFIPLRCMPGAVIVANDFETLEEMIT